MAQKKKRKFGMTGIIFTVCLFLIVAPFACLGWMLLSTYMDSNAPVLGNRYENDLDPAITKEQMTKLDEAVGALEGIEGHSVALATGTVRIYIDIPDDGTADTASAKASEAYTALTTVLDPAVYLTQHDDMKMYDTEIHVYNLTEGRDADNFVYGIYTKTSAMTDPQWSLVSEPKNAELAQSLRDAVEARKAAEAEAAAAAEAENTTEDTQQQQTEEDTEAPEAEAAEQTEAAE